MKLHLHQEEIQTNIRSFFTNDERRGQILVPTGGGKTLNEALAIIDLFKMNKGKVAVILDPRIGLSIQVMGEVVQATIRDGSYENTQFIACHSGGMNEKYITELLRSLEIKGLEQKDFVNTTRSSEIKSVVEKALKRGKNVVIASTYHSADSIPVKVDLIVSDEAHWLVSHQFGTLIDHFTDSSWLFFTATQKFTKSDAGLGWGMNNSERFGRIVGKISSAELIKRGIIVPPRLAIIRGRGVNQDKNKDVISNLVYQLKLQAKTAKDYGCPKVIVSCEEVPQAKAFYSHYIKLQKDNKLPKGFKHVAMISSETGCLMDGEVVQKREDFFKSIKETKNGIIIFHYDIISEGIDVDGISGICILRNMDKVKFIQTIGRALRVLNSDKKLDISDRKKKFGLITIPLLENNYDDQESLKEDLMEIIMNIRSGGFEPPFVMLDEPEGKDEEGPEFDELMEDEVDLSKMMTGKNIKELEDVQIMIEEQFDADEVSVYESKLKSVSDMDKWFEVAGAA